MAVAKEQIRQIISENNISSVADVYSLLRDSFKDILQELLEAEMDASLIVTDNAVAVLTATALPAYQAGRLFLLRRCHAVKGTVQTPAPARRRFLSRSAVSGSAGRS